jgi:hypothetical protein
LQKKCYHIEWGLPSNNTSQDSARAAI